MQVFDPYDLPSCVKMAPLPLVSFMGLNIHENSSHLTIWHAFTHNRRPDRCCLSFKLTEASLSLPFMKQKRQSYEWYIPKGIFKSNWVNKYLCEIPSLIILFWDLEWNDAHWQEKKQAISDKIQQIKSVLGGRNTKVALVLIQSTSSIPGDDVTTAEKAATLCTLCDLPAKCLFVLPHTDAHLLGYIIRLENALNEIAMSFYIGEAKRIRSHKEYLNKTSHQLLFVRHQFKLGFFCEVRSDLQTALKYYMQSYHYIVELRSSDANLQEIRMAAAIVSYKICHLDFTLNLPRDAIAQFRRHIDFFQQNTGPKELMFEHYGWLSKQYQIFGDVFEEAVCNGLPAVQTQHPGFYYQQASQYAVLRRKIAIDLYEKSSQEFSADLKVLEGWSDLEYYGQRPWRPNKHSLEPSDPDIEDQGIKALQYFEAKEVDHSSTIVPLFSSAIIQFKKYRSPRIRHYLMVQMAEEYVQAHDPAKALTLLNHVMWDYRNEQWWALLTYSTLLAIKCAYLTASIPEFIGLSLEIMGPRLLVSQEEKKRACNNFEKILQGFLPDPETSLTSDLVVAATGTWYTSFQNYISPWVVDMTTIVPCLEVRASFYTAKIPVNSDAHISVKFRNSYSRPFHLSKLFLLASIPAYSETLIESCPEKLLLSPNEITEIIFTFKPFSEDTGRVLKVEYSKNSLVWEWLPVDIAIVNEEDDEIKDISVSMSLDPSSECQLEHTTQVYSLADIESERIGNRVGQVTLGNLPRGKETSCTLFVKSLTAAQRQLAIKVTYNITVTEDKKKYSCLSVYTESFATLSKIPFQVSIEKKSLKFEPVNQVAVRESFVILPQIISTAHVPVVLTESSLLLGKNIKSDGEVVSQVAGCELSEGDVAMDCFAVYGDAQVSVDAPINLGQYILYWKRKDSKAPPVSISIGLPSLTFETTDIWVEMEMPPQGFVKTPLTIHYVISNRTFGTLDMVVIMKASEAFMFSGNKEMRLRIQPDSAQGISYILYPLLAGNVQLPKLSVTLDSSVHGTSISFESLLNRILPTHIFVVPQAKKPAVLSSKTIPMEV